MHLDEIYCLPMPHGFGTAIDVDTGEMRVQQGPGRYQSDPFDGQKLAYKLRDTAARVLSPHRKIVEDKNVPIYRVCRCGRYVTSRTEGVSLFRAPEHKRAHFSGLTQCGSVWHCAVCMQKLAVRRQAEVVASVATHKASGGSVYMVTCTVSHTHQESLKSVLEDQAASYRRANSGKKAKEARSRFEILGTIKALEVTHGKNGWHPHTHTLVFTRSQAPIAEIRTWYGTAWQKACEKVSGRKVTERGCDVQEGFDPAYIAKWGISSELVEAFKKEGKKGNRSAMELLSDATDGDKEAEALWTEFAITIAAKGAGRVETHRQLVWSPGLKKRFSIGEKTDDKLVSEETANARLLGTISFEQWTKILAQQFDARLVVLQLGSISGWDAVEAFINSL